MSTTSKIISYVAQPDAFTCQSACIAKMIGSTDVKTIRDNLLDLGEPGNPYIMGKYLAARVEDYEFIVDASINEMRQSLKDGWQLITHGYFTNGHVISLVGTTKNGLIVDDPWGEFMAGEWRYTGIKDGDNLEYSDRLIYAACVGSYSLDEAIALYNDGAYIPEFKNAWLHKIKN